MIRHKIFIEYFWLPKRTCRCENGFKWMRVYSCYSRIQIIISGKMRKFHIERHMQSYFMCLFGSMGLVFQLRYAHLSQCRIAKYFFFFSHLQ